MNSLISLHSYLMLNSAIAIGYIISRSILGLPYAKQRLLQIERLKFARYSFLICIASFFLVANILIAIPSAYHSNFQLEPLLKSASSHFVPQHIIIAEQTTKSTWSFLSINMILVFVFLSGFVLFSIKYIKNLVLLKKLQKDSFCQHKINNIHILFNHTTDIPFCWVLLKNHFISIPYLFLNKQDDLKLAIKHKLQHIRQGDTRWLHFLMLIKPFCFWNPFMVRQQNLWVDGGSFSLSQRTNALNFSIVFSIVLTSIASSLRGYRHRQSNSS